MTAAKDKFCDIYIFWGNKFILLADESHEISSLYCYIPSGCDKVGKCSLLQIWVGLKRLIGHVKIEFSIIIKTNLYHCKNQS